MGVDISSMEDGGIEFLLVMAGGRVDPVKGTRSTES